MKRLFLGLVGLLAMLASLYHLGLLQTDLQPPDIHYKENPHASGTLQIDRFGMRHVFLLGAPFGIGVEYSRLTKDLMEEQEKRLIAKMEGFFHYPWLIKAFIAASALYFSGLDQKIKPEHREQMFGVSKGASTAFNTLGTPYARQIAYHGLHEIGQMMIDQSWATMGCTVMLWPSKNGSIVGRNFDFDADRIFDDKKILKWVFPNERLAYLSVTWAGMVGVVTGVNEKGVYLSLNAAGSDDWRRIGTPTTLVVLDVLENARSAKEALQIIEAAQTFITDIFVVADASGSTYRIEKSPSRSAILQITQPTALTNHLQDPIWSSDTVNAERKRESTSLHRLARATELLQSYSAAETPSTGQMIRWLRDRKALHAESLTLGHPSAINPLIAVHGVVYDTLRGAFAVSLYDSLRGAFVEYDLSKSFEAKRPVILRQHLPDPEVSHERYEALLQDRSLISKSGVLLKKHQCDSAQHLLLSLHDRRLAEEILGDLSLCLEDRKAAMTHWQEALSLRPGYQKDRLRIELKIKELGP